MLIGLRSVVFFCRSFYSDPGYTFLDQAAGGMDWLKPLNEYCERAGPEFWSEPVNALSNISFILGAVFAYRLAQQKEITSYGVNWLLLLLLSVGIGSFLYHTFANLWSMFSDSLPIYIFQLSTVTIFGAAIARRKGWPQFSGSLSLLLIFIGLTAFFFQFPRQLFNGSIAYFSAFLTLLLLGIYFAKQSIEHRYDLLSASAAFAVALLFRSIDMQLCSSFPLGTHFVWHILNGLVLYLVIRSYIGILLSESKSNKLRKRDTVTGTPS